MFLPGAMHEEITTQHDTPHHRETVHRLSRISLFGFIMTFIIARAVVFLIMSHAVPNMYFFMNGTHVHHLNYGIFALAVVAGYSVMRRPTGGKAELTALLYGFAMALTFDEFGMWLHLGGSYWQRVSVDAVVVIGALLALLAFARSIRKFEARHFWGFLALAIALIFFVVVLYTAGAKLGDVMGPTLQQLEASSSP
jgi:hypothetical protein